MLSPISIYYVTYKSVNPDGKRTFPTGNALCSLKRELKEPISSNESYHGSRVHVGLKSSFVAVVFVDTHIFVVFLPQFLWFMVAMIIVMVIGKSSTVSSSRNN